MTRQSEIGRIISTALKEDAAFEDITTHSLIDKNQTSRAYIIFKEEAVVCGLEIVKAALRRLDKNITFQSTLRDGDRVKKNTRVLSMRGKTRALLSGERTALNFLGHLSGISTNTDRFVRKIRPFKTVILDTRKTTPGLRLLEKYAVRCGGGVNHRADLNDMILIKDNHKLVYEPRLSSIEVIKKLKKKTRKPIEIEVENLSQLKEVLKARPDFILLDNMPVAQIKQAVCLNTTLNKNKKILLEASGGIHLNNIRAFAQTGVDRISVGALTHSSNAIDVSMEFI